MLFGARVTQGFFVDIDTVDTRSISVVGRCAARRRKVRRVVAQRATRRFVEDFREGDRRSLVVEPLSNE